MTNPTESAPRETFVYFIPFPSVLPAFELAIASVVLLIFIGIPLGNLGLQRTLESIRNNTWLWLVMAAMCAPLIGLCLRFAFPPNSWLARLEFRQDGVRFVPRPVLRWIGEPTTDISLSPQPREILLCRGSQDRIPYGYRLLIRWPEGRDRVIKLETGSRLNARQSGILINGITTATGHPVHLVQRQFAADGSYREIPWTPAKSSTHLGGIAKTALAATPFIGGIVIGLLRPGILTVVMVGIALWLCQTLAVFSYARITHQRSKLATLYWFTTLFTFAASYAAAFAIVFYAIHLG